MIKCLIQKVITSQKCFKMNFKNYICQDLKCAKLYFSIYADCPSSLNNDMLIVNPAFMPPQYNTSGELECTNGGALFLGNASYSNKTFCNKTAQWDIDDASVCCTGTVYL